MDLSEWHRSTFKPAIEHLLNSSQLSFTLLRLNSQVINVLSMQICNLGTSEFLQLFNRANTDNLFTIFWNPQWDRITPIPVSGEAPILWIFKPVSESFLLDGLWNPSSFHVVLEKIIFKFGNFNEPCRDSFVNERSVTSPTEGIVVFLGFVDDDSSSIFEILDDYFISIFYVDSFVFWHLFCEFASFIQWSWWVIWGDYFLSYAKFVIVLTETWGAVDDTRTCITSNEITSQHLEASILLPLLKEIKQRRVLNSLQIAPLKLLQNFILLISLLFIQSSEPTFSQNEYFISLQIFNFNVVEVRVHS